MAANQAPQKMDYNVLKDLLNKSISEVMGKLRDFKGKDDISIAEMFEMQMLMNHLSQLSEMSTNVVAASNQAIVMMARNVK